MEYEIINNDCINRGNRREHFLSCRGTMSEGDFCQFRLRCQVLESYTSIRSLLYTVSRNGTELKDYLNPLTLFERYQATKPSAEKMIREANRLALNFATALKTLVEISTSKLNDKKDAKMKYEAFQSNVFDYVQGYRFWIKLRNYVVHRKMLYENYSIADNSVILSVSSDSLLEWQGWNARQKEDIRLLDGENCLETILSAIFSAFLLIGEWATIQQEEFDNEASFIIDFMKQHKVTGELYLGRRETFNDGEMLKLYYPPTYEIQNVSSIINWRKYIAQNGEFDILDSIKNLEELIPYLDEPFN